MLTYPMYYHDTNQEVWLTLNPRCLVKYAKWHIKSFRAVLSKWLPLCWATSNDYNFSTFFDDILHLNTETISRICCFQNYIYLSKYPKPVSTGFVSVGRIWTFSIDKLQRMQPYISYVGQLCPCSGCGCVRQFVWDMRDTCFLCCFFCCPIICADLRGTAPAPLVPASPTFGHTMGSFRIVTLPPEVHRKWRQIIGRLPSKGNTALLLGHFGGVQ